MPEKGDDPTTASCQQQDPDRHDAQVGPLDDDRQDRRDGSSRRATPSTRATTSSTSTPTRSRGPWSRRWRADPADDRRASGDRAAGRRGARRRGAGGGSRRRDRRGRRGGAGRGRVRRAGRAGRGPQPQLVEIGGRTISYLTLAAEEPCGDPVVLVHGFGGDKNSWLFVQQPLSEDHAVHALDLPGHGASGKDVGDGSLARLADVVVGFLDALGISRAHLVGHSLGGAVVAAAARSAPEKVASLTLLAPAGYGARTPTRSTCAGSPRRRPGGSSNRWSGGCSRTPRWSPGSWWTTCCATSGSTGWTRPWPRCSARCSTATGRRSTRRRCSTASTCR